MKEFFLQVMHLETLSSHITCICLVVTKSFAVTL